jgi:uncharacterized glyoxalase superfamily protein PhnB
LWFDNQAEEAAAFYTAIFKNSSICRITRYGKKGFVHGRAEGSVMTVEFEFDGQAFTALNGGPVFMFNETVSFQVLCETQQEMDFYWERLAEGGDEPTQQCGWLISTSKLAESEFHPDRVPVQRLFFQRALGERPAFQPAFGKAQTKTLVADFRFHLGQLRFGAAAAENDGLTQQPRQQAVVVRHHAGGERRQFDQRAALGARQ